LQPSDIEYAKKEIQQNHLHWSIPLPNRNPEQRRSKR